MPVQHDVTHVGRRQELASIRIPLHTTAGQKLNAIDMPSGLIKCSCKLSH